MKKMPVKNEKKDNSNKSPSDDIKLTLMNKYKEILVDKLTRQDLRDLQFYLKNQFNEKRQLNAEYKLKFESRLRQYFHEEVLRREIVSIETLVSLLKPEDVRN
jgi:Fe-S cluster assembly scaffold protein SufB